MSTTAWRFQGTEGADTAVLRLRQLDSQDLIDVQDVAVLRWPEYAAGPTVQEHVTDDASKMSSMLTRMKHGRIDRTMIDSVKSDMTPGTSVLVLLSAAAVIESVAQAFTGQRMELIRSDLSVQEQDRIRNVLGRSSPN